METDPPVTPTCADPWVVRRLIGTSAVSWVALTNVVPRLVGEPEQKLHQVTTELPTKFVPVTVNVTAVAVPAVALDGEMDVTAATGLIVNVFPAETTPLVASVTVIEAVPAVVKTVEGMVAVIDVAVLAVTVNWIVVEVVQSTTGLAGKLVPVSVRLTAELPADAEAGLMLVRDGAGLIVNVCVEVDAAVPLVTPTVAIPEAVRRDVGMVAVSAVELTKVVVRAVGEPPQALHQVAVEEPLTKFVPVTDSVTALVVPAIALVGEIAVTVGALMVKLRVLVVMLMPSVTRIVAVPVAVSTAAGIVAVMELEELDETVRAVVVPEKVQLTVGEAGKEVPLSTTVVSD